MTAYTSYQLKRQGTHRRFDPCTRLELARRFTAMYRGLGLDLAGCANFLHVTERTLRNWESGKHDIPFAAYKLLRLMARMELPGQTWDGWCFVGGVLYTPEGRPITGKDGAWWSLLVRQAAMFGEIYARHAASSACERCASSDARAAGGWAGRESSVTPHFSPADRKNRPQNGQQRKAA